MGADRILTRRQQDRIARAVNRIERFDDVGSFARIAAGL